MADQFQWDVVVRLATQGLKGAKGDVEGFAEALKEMTDAGKVSETAGEQATKAYIAQGRAAKTAASDTRQMTESVNALRYANYDLGRSLLTISAGITAAGVGVVAAAGSFESSFTAVERTSGVVGDAVGELRGELVALTREIPQSFGEISNIGARGAQLGIASDQLAEFTEVVAQFVATSDTVSLDQAVEAFGRISNLTGEQDFNALGSAITLVGVNAAATEAQIVKTTQELAPFAAAVGMSTADVIGLSAAVASLGQPPERARSAFLTLQRVVDGAVNGMNDSLGAFANLLGMTEEQVASLWRTDPGQFTQAFVDALGSVDNLTVAFDQLGINERRAVQVFQALAADSRNAGAGMSVLDRAISDSNQGFTEGTELQRQYALILDDLSSKWQIFLNSLMEVAAAIGGNLLPTIKALLDGVTEVTQNFADFAASDIGGVIIRIATSIGIMVAAWAGIRGAIALATGAALAFNFVTAATGGAGIIGGLRGLASAFGLVGGAAGSASVGASRLTAALKAVGKATVILALIQAAIQLVTDFGGSMQWLAEVATNVVNFVGTVFGQMVHFVADAISAIADITFIPAFKEGLKDASTEVRNFAKEFEKVGLGDVAMGGFRDWADTLPAASDGVEDFTNAAEKANWGQYAEGADEFGEALGGPGGVGDNAQSAAQEVRTLVDYANDLQSVFSRAFDIRFAGGSTLDAITSTFIGIREATEASAQNIRKLKGEIQGLQSDLKIQQYFLGIAIEYGDTKRAEAIQANIAKLQGEIAGKTKDLSEEQSKNSKTLTGNSKAAIDNRKKIEDLVKQYQAHLTALAASGMSQDELSRKSEQLRAEFVRQATQLGFSRAEVEKYAVAFDDMTIAINNVPRNITVRANVNPALQALNELNARAKSVNRTLSSVGSGLGSAGGSLSKGADRLLYRTEYAIAMAKAAALSLQAIFSGNPFEAVAYNTSAAAYRILAGNYRRRGGFAEGGYTGRGGKYEPAGVVHKGEYVIPKKDVNQRTGLPYADAMGRLQRGASGPGYANGGYVRGSGGIGGPQQIASFGPMAYQQLHQALQQVVLLDGQKVATNSADHYAQSTAQGAY